MPQTRRELLGTLAAAVAPVAQLTRAAAPAKRPNIVVVLADDQGWGDLSIHGNTNLSTPNIDSLARDGALMERFFVCSVCAPTRAEFLTGRYHSRGGVRGVSTGMERLNLDETTIAQSFRAAGYRTGAFGKWHNGSQHPYHPNARGFEEYYGFTSGHWGQYFDTEMDHNGVLTRGKSFIIDDLTNHALSFIESNRARPFFCYLPMNIPHSPMQVPDQFYKKFKGADLRMRARNEQQEDIEFTRAALAMCENIDYNVGRVLQQLRRLSLERDTVVLYFSDNGPNSWRWNGGMKGRKGSLDEGGLRVPCLVRWPGHIPAGLRVPQIAGAIDLLPTFADFAQVKHIGQKPLDGKSLRPLLTNQGGAWPDRMLFTMQNRRASVRTQQYRMDPTGQLFDMQADPLQDRDVAAERPEVASRLKRAVEEWTKEVLPPAEDTRPYPVGYARETLLPARDGVPHGGVKRSAGAPNCSYFTNWTDTAGSMTWDIETAQPGEYEAFVHYTCPADAAGASIELSFQGVKAAAKISVPHDPPLVGAAFDRVSRGGESYVKDFRELSLGRMKLPKDRGLLTLRALEVPGKQVADVRRAGFRRLA